MRFQVMGLDGSATELFETDDVDEAIRFVDKYVSSGDAGNWDMIEVYDREFAEDPGLVTVYSWEIDPMTLALRQGRDIAESFT